MIKKLAKHTFCGDHSINICGSKSESNRLLILKALYPNINIENLSTSDDTIVLEKALNQNLELIDIHHAGTAMRFLTAYYAFYSKKTIILTGSRRMQNRPIEILVDALNSLGANVEYTEKKGFPPLKISPSTITKNKVELQANVSSQYISALMLSAPRLPQGLEISFTSDITSFPYLKMTIDLMKKLGIEVEFNGKYIYVKPKHSSISKTIAVESDWSSASYFYSLVALSPNLKLRLKTYKKSSLQGDAELSKLYDELGVKTSYDKNSIILENTKKPKALEYIKNLNNTPDLAQTIAVTCLGLNLKCKLTGLHTLKIKETDRLIALKTEIEKLGAKVEIDENSLSLFPKARLKPDQNIETYNDHRMAMAFAPISGVINLNIIDAGVVSKSYPNFWIDYDKLKNYS